MATLPGMGQPVAVKEIPSVARPGAVRFETNRPLTGMGHRHYDGPAEVPNPNDPADILAERLFARGGIDHLHIYSNVITIDVSKGFDTAGITDIIEDLFGHYV